MLPVDRLTLQLAFSQATSRGQKQALGALLSELRAPPPTCPFCRSTETVETRTYTKEPALRCLDCDATWVTT